MIEISTTGKLIIAVYLIGIVLFPVVIGFFEHKADSLWDNIFEIGWNTFLLSFFCPLILIAVCFYCAFVLLCFCVAILMFVFGSLWFSLTLVGMGLRAIVGKRCVRNKKKEDE